MKKWNMIIDVARCHDCNNCFLADKDEFVGNDFPPYSVAQPWDGHRWMNIFRQERGQFPIVQVSYLPLPCMHCDEAPCIRDSPPGTIYKREDGLVVIDPEKAKGRPEIVQTCPYGVMYWNEEAQVAQKCTGCAHLMDEGWTETRCSQVCPTGAIKLVLAEEEEVAKLQAAEGLVAFKADLGTKPRVLYKNLDKWTKCFLSGSVVFGDTDECGEGAKIEVKAGENAVGWGEANSYGEFVVDGLDPGREYSLSVSAPGYQSSKLTATPKASVNLGHIVLNKA